MDSQPTTASTIRTSIVTNNGVSVVGNNNIVITCPPELLLELTGTISRLTDKLIDMQGKLIDMQEKVLRLESTQQVTNCN